MPKTTTKPMVRIHNTETDEVIDREMTDDEFAQYEADKAAHKAAEAVKAKAEADKVAILKRLGLTEDELKIILG
jgi:hypothetical protein